MTATHNNTDEMLDQKSLLVVLTALHRGDFSMRMPNDLVGLSGKVADMVNQIMDMNERNTRDFERISHQVGKEGKIDSRFTTTNLQGAWMAQSDAMNRLIDDLLAPMDEVVRVVGAISIGDLSQRVATEVGGRKLEGQFAKYANLVNTTVDRLGTFASEVTRVAREVGSEGKLGGQAVVPGATGTWRDLTDSVNSMAANLTGQVRNIAQVTTAVAQGDLSKKIIVDAQGEILELKETINTMVDQLSIFASEVTRVAREVGSEGKLGGQGNVPGVEGTWKELTDNVNTLAANLTVQVRSIAQVTTAVAKGDLSKQITIEVKGEMLELKNTINIMVDQLSTFASEVTRVAREVGTEGILGGQAAVPGVAGTWKDLTNSVNSMAANLTGQVRNIAQVTTAVASGDLGKKITVEAQGEILQLKETINTMVDQLATFASEVTRVAREVGSEGKLGGQADVSGVGGTWKELTDNVNLMASNLTGQVRNIAEVTVAVANGDLSRKITVDVRGEFLQLKETINTMVDQLRAFASEVTRVAREVGMEGRLGSQAYVTGVSGTWKDLTESVNMLASNLTSQVRNIALVTTAVANGDLGKKVTVDVKGEILELKNTVNTMVDQLNGFAAEVTRVAREVGTDGKLGGQAQVRGASGTWKDLTDNVNMMASNLTNQVRGIAKVVTAVANGDLKQRLTLEAKGEIAELAYTINGMTETLGLFADQVTTVAREVGVEGRLGGQANVPGASGTWLDLTDNVNQLAANLTSQVRAIAAVATAVTKGDLSRSVSVEARGEVSELKDNVNEMIRNLRETTRQNAEQDWLKTNLTKFTRVLQGQRDLVTVSKSVLSELAPLVNAHHGVFYIIIESQDSVARLHMIAAYAYKERKNLSTEWKIGEGLVGQCAYEKQRILLTNVPDDYVQITSGLGEATPLNIVVLPVLFEGKVKAVIELASFERYSVIHQAFLDQLAESIGVVINTVEVNTRTEDLLKQSQSLAEELQGQQEELRQTNEELEIKARLLEEQKVTVEMKSREIEQAKTAVEEKAAQLSLTSKYKSEFLSNMSHELRTPLNSLLILAQQLAENPQGHLDNQEIEFAKTIRGAGEDLLSLINEILDLSKIESGTVSLEMATVPFDTIAEQVERTFRHLAQRKGLGFHVSFSRDLPINIVTDEKRLLQVLKNLLSNAFKFTEKGSVTVDVSIAYKGWSEDNQNLNRAKQVFSFSVEDTGIGIAKDKQRIIFEAFQQGDGSTARKFGGTGLGLSISREIAILLGGELKLEQSSTDGSTFVLYVPKSNYDELDSTSNYYPRAAIDVPQMPAERPVAPVALSHVVHTSNADHSSHSNYPTHSSSVDQSVKNNEDDRDIIQSSDRTLLIIEDDMSFARILLGVARAKGLKGIIANQGKDAIVLARQFKPVAITLDVDLPDMSGWNILNIFKQDVELRHIPIDVISGVDNVAWGLKEGAFKCLVKPVTSEALNNLFVETLKLIDKSVKNLLLVIADKDELAKIKSLLDVDGVNIQVATSGKAGLALMRKKFFDCLVLEVKMPDMSAVEFVSTMTKDRTMDGLPLIIYIGKEITDEERLALAELTGIRDLIKTVDAPSQLLNQTSLFLHSVITNLPEEKREMLEGLAESACNLRGKTVLIVDDDPRNLFALTAALERKGIIVLTAESGVIAINLLTKTKGVDLILMDVMMPGMDGYETTRKIRTLPGFKTLPIVSLTAKAMPGDREKSIQSGASDYLSKPVNLEQLILLMQVLFSR